MLFPKTRPAPAWQIALIPERGILGLGRPGVLVS